MVDFIIDGSNVLLGLRVKRVPSVRAFARLLAALDEKAMTYSVWFDNSVRSHLAGHPEEGRLFDALLKVLQGAALVNMAAHADTGIQNSCKEFDCPVINSSDNNTSWAYQPTIYRCRLTANKSSIFVAPAHSRNRILQANLDGSFNFRGLRFPVSATPGDDAESPVVKMPHLRRPPSQNGNLLVLALDASQSMDATDTYDGRSRTAHVNDILRKSIAELTTSAIAAQLYIAVLAFSSDVITLSPDDNGSIFSPVRDWRRWLDSGLAAYETYVERAQTNIRLVLDRASDYVDQFRSSDEAPKLARKWTSAAVVTLTDGAHFLGDPERAETSQDILGHVFHTLNRSENIQFAFVGLGAHADHMSMTAWASEATERQKQVARLKSPPVQLTDNRLYVKVDNADVNMGGIIRSFVDVVSGASGRW
jgi:hypothetical protein